MYYIGIDLGTSAVKLLLMDEQGRIAGSVSREYPIRFPEPGWSEQDPQDWWEETLLGLEQLLEPVDASQVAAVGLGGQMHGLVILDREGQVIRPAILWNDGRTQKECDYLNEEIGRKTLTRYTGNIAFAGFTAPKLLWLREHEPEHFQAIRQILLPKDYIVWKLTGVFSTDVSDASGTLLFDVQNRRWSEEMCRICQIREEQLPFCHESFQCVGTLKPEIAARLGLSPAVKVAAGAGDNAAAAVGTGTVGESRCNISLGTSGTIFLSSSHFKVDPYNALHSFAHADGTWHLMGCMLSAASCNQWWMDRILKTRDYEKEQESIAGLGQNRVFFLPYLMGERSPHNDPNARGVFAGMSMDTDRSHMTQAVMEGVAFGLRDSLEAARALGICPRETRICGGGARSLLWRKILANVMNLRTERLESEEGPALGGAILAAVADGCFSSPEEGAAKIVRVRDVVEPEPELAARYQERYEKFRQIYPACRELFQTLA